MGTPMIPSVDSDTKLFPKSVMDALTAAFGSGSASNGYDIVVLAGQSNMSGRGMPFSAATDPVNPLVFQYRNTIQPASEPLMMPDNPQGIGPGLQFARWYASRKLAAGRKVLLVPQAVGGTPLSSSATAGWRRGVANNLYAAMISQTQNALTAAGVSSRIVALLWLQGETDGDQNTTGDQYKADFDALVNGARVDLGVPDLPVVIGTMVPEYLSTGTRAQINAVHRDTPNRISRTDVAVSATAMNAGDGNHFNGAGSRFNGKAMFDAYERITAGLAPYSEPLTIKALGISQASQAYSLRKVGDNYGGNAVQVRRSSDNATKDIGFSGTSLDTASLLSFAGGGDAFVATWYDQSGNARHISQTTTAAQPKLVASGSVVTSGGKPAVTFDGVDDCLVNSSPALFSAGAATALQVISSATPTGAARTWTETVSTASNQYGLMQPDAADSRAFPVMSGAFSFGTISPAPSLAFFNGAIHQGSSVDTGSAISQWVDGAADTMNGFTYTRVAAPYNTFTLGGATRAGSLAAKAMAFSELVTFPRALSDADRATAAANQKSFYGTP